MLREAEIYYYDYGWVLAAVEQATADGVDVLNMSLHVYGCGFDACDPEYDCSLNNAL